ncbi:MAG: YifB family Mg chelatase-like AAA ATPase [Polyangiales bacterium]
MLAIAHAACLQGIEAVPVQVEVRLGSGLPGIDIVGLPERGVKESRVRVQAALETIGFALPPRRLMINLAPGDLRKTGSGFDLAIAVAILGASGAIELDSLHRTLFVGELGLDGSLRGVPGVLAQLQAACIEGLEAAVVPLSNAHEASLAHAIDSRIANDIGEVVASLMNGESLCVASAVHSNSLIAHAVSTDDLQHIRGQASARRVLEIAAAGKHNLLMSGPPGAGKSHLARCLPSILPEPTPEEQLSICTITTAAGLSIPKNASIERPFRAPHHNASANAIAGGGDPVRPGEITLAHGGVLFLDEFPEFHRDAIEALRTSMQEGRVCISRASHRVIMPAAPLIVAAMNPCPCGYDGDPKFACHCGATRIAIYKRKLSGPILDRFDLFIDVQRLSTRELREKSVGESSSVVKSRVQSAHDFLRHDASSITLNNLAEHVSNDALRLLDEVSETDGLSVRAYLKSLNVGRTIAALAGQTRVDAPHLAEALRYRPRLATQHDDAPARWRASKQKGKTHEQQI